MRAFIRFSIPSWIVSGLLLKRPRLDLGSLQIDDALVPLLRRLGTLSRLGGISLVVCAEKR